MIKKKILNRAKKTLSTEIKDWVASFEDGVEREKVNVQTLKWIKDNPDHNEKTIITIPVVVHVVWNTNAENISDAQIFSQIDVLNADFRRTNTDAINTPNVWQNIAIDSEIDFCLANIDPNGSATNGITRTQTSQTSFFDLWFKIVKISNMNKNTIHIQNICVNKINNELDRNCNRYRNRFFGRRSPCICYLG